MKKSFIVTAVIVILILLFAAFIARAAMPAPATPDAQGAQSATGAQTDGRQRQSGGTPDGDQAGGRGQGGRQEQAGGAPGGEQGGRQGQSGGTPGGGQGGAPGGGGRTAAVVRVTVVEPGTIENSVVINGDVLTRNQVTIFPTVGGKLTESRITVGDRVGRGAVVAMVDPSRPGEVYSHSPVISTVSGTVLQAPFSVGDTVSAQSALYVLGDLSSLRVEAFVPERYVSSVRQGLRAQVWFESLPGETFYAEVDEVSPVLEPASRTLRIRLRFTDDKGTAATDSRIKAGMFATLSLVTRTRTDVPVIPRSSAINTYGRWIVFTVDENNTARRHEAELGIENEDSFEVISGIDFGDRVVTQGQNFLSDGDPVRIVE